MIKLKNNKTKFIYTKSAGYINISCIVRFYLDRYDNSYHIDTCNTLSSVIHLLLLNMIYQKMNIKN